MALLCIHLVIIELVLCVVVNKVAGSRDDGGWSMVGKRASTVSSRVARPSTLV
jgi:hypothetical protein